MLPRNTKVTILVLMSALFLILVTLGACQPIAAPTKQSNGIEILFETIALNEGGANIDIDTVSIEPKLFLLTDFEQLAEIKTWVNPQTLTILQQVDFQQESVIALFRGRKPSANYQAIIEHIKQYDNRLIVHAQFWEPNPQLESAAEITYPYHLVKIAKRDISFANLELVLQPTTITPAPPAN